MPVTRCPSCQLPMTEEEADVGACPVCAAPLLPAPPQAAVSPSAAGTKRSPALLWAAAAGGFVVFAALVTGVVMLLLQPVAGTKPHAQRDKSTSDSSRVVADARSSPAVPTLPEKAKSTTPLPAKTDAKSSAPVETKTSSPGPAKTTPPVVVEAKKKEDVKKKEEPIPDPKKEDDKKVIAKKPDVPEKDKGIVKPMKDAVKHGWAVLPLRAAGAVTIDGDLIDWRDVPPLPLKAVERGRAIKKPVIMPDTQTAYVAYTSQGIVVAVDVVDTSGELENQGKPAKGMWPFWDNDVVEVYLDTLNVRPRDRGDPNLHQFFALPLGAPGEDDNVFYESRILRKGGRTDWTVAGLAKGEGVVRAGRKTPAGWTLEMLIPKSALRLGEFKPGAIFGFELQIDTGTNIYYFWTCHDPHAQVSTHPHLWGEIVLGGGDAVVEFVNETGKPAKEFAPGMPLAVRITDADANFDPAKKEQLSVNVRSKTGDVKVLLLDETAPGSGVFTGSLPTRLDASRRDKKTLDVRNDDVVSVEYIDRIRANGERDVPVRAEIVSEKR